MPNYTVHINSIGEGMHPLKGRKQLPEHIAKRMASGAGRARNTADTLWAKVDRKAPNECWPWLGFRNEQGYGRTWIDDRGYYAHRVIYDLANPGQIEREAPKSTAEKGWLMHSCDNPSCCNPSHLSVGTHADNMRDKAEKKRCPDYRGQKSPRASITDELAVEIRRLHGYGISAREMSRLFGISRNVVQGVVSGRHYSEA